MKRLIFIQNIWRCDDNPLFQPVPEAKVMDTIIVGNVDALYHNYHHNFKRRSSDFISFNLLSALEMRQSFFHQTGYEIPIFHHNTGDLLQQLISNFKITHCRIEQPIAIDEVRELTKLQQRFPDLVIETPLCETLFASKELKFDKVIFNKSFTNFRKKLEAKSLAITISDQIIDLSELKAFDSNLFPIDEVSDVRPLACQIFQPGEKAAQARLQYYLNDSHCIKSYKATRNGLLGFDFSSKLSPWLAHGALSPKRVVIALENYELAYGANESTYWLKFELLWREFFKHAMLYYPKSFFLANGIQNQVPYLDNDSEVFSHWVNATTSHDFINANMIELEQTGYMSNRGRQVVASYLINELGHDWRMGAYYFQEKLIDYDVSSNWCNWAYLAGVGHDPRKRHFNVDKQQCKYDPDNKFVNYWLDKRR